LERLKDWVKGWSPQVKQAAIAAVVLVCLTVGGWLFVSKSKPQYSTSTQLQPQYSIGSISGGYNQFGNSNTMVFTNANNPNFQRLPDGRIVVTSEPTILTNELRQVLQSYTNNDFKGCFEHFSNAMELCESSARLGSPIYPTWRYYGMAAISAQTIGNNSVAKAYAAEMVRRNLTDYDLDTLTNMIMVSAFVGDCGTAVKAASKVSSQNFYRSPSKPAGALIVLLHSLAQQVVASGGSPSDALTLEREALFHYGDIETYSKATGASMMGRAEDQEARDILAAMPSDFLPSVLASAAEDATRAGQTNEAADFTKRRDALLKETVDQNADRRRSP
jgi:hypothetical protein